jgi:hypothetical protein
MPSMRQAEQTITGSAVAGSTITSTRFSSGAEASEARRPQCAHTGRRRSAIRESGLSDMGPAAMVDAFAGQPESQEERPAVGDHSRSDAAR